MRFWPLAVVCFGLGCGASGPTGAALHSDLKTLQREIEEARRAGDLDESAVRALAAAVAERELRAARGDLAVDRVREFRGCLHPLADTFMDLAEGRTAAAPAATHALLAANQLPALPLFEKHFGVTDPAWRAVAARAALGAARGGARRQFMRDGDIRVRRAALHAAIVERDSADLGELVEAARLDPDPLARSLAVQALGAIGERPAVRALRELWPGAELATRQGIVSAWGRSKAFQAGGEAELLWILETQTDLPVVVAAERLLALSERHAAQAAAVLLRIINDGPVDERRLAILLSPDAPEFEAAIAELLAPTAPADEALQVMAAARLVRAAKFRNVASKRLRALLVSKTETIRRSATAALVAVRDPAVVAHLKQGLNSPAERVRQQAAVGLFLFGNYAEAASALGDERSQVRSHVACTILAQR